MSDLLYECEICDFSSRYVHNLNRHMLSKKHKQNATQLCMENNKSESELELESESESESELESELESESELELESESELELESESELELESESESESESELDTYACEICNFSSKYIGNLHRHVLSNKHIQNTNKQRYVEDDVYESEDDSDGDTPILYLSDLFIDPKQEDLGQNYVCIEEALFVCIAISVPFLCAINYYYA
jgi:hypothetical protein